MKLGLTVTGLGLGGLNTSAVSAEIKTPEPNRPNILLIMTDQQIADAMSCTGNPYLKTPAMDRLAADGVLFNNAYCANPVCVPSRVSIFNGRMPHEMGVYYNLLMQKNAKHLPMLGKVVRDAGYDTGYVGKWHLVINPEDKETHGFDFMRNYKESDVADSKMLEGCTEYLNRSRRKPFFLVASFINPHDVCEWARGSKLRDGEIGGGPAAGFCPILPANHEVLPDDPGILKEIKEKYKATLYPTHDWDEEKWRQYRWASYRLTEKVDAHIEKLINEVERAGVIDNTVILFVSDHGDGGGEHKWNQKQVLYDCASRVPMIISYKGTGLSRRDESLVSTGLDILPTICDWAGAKVPRGCRGMSLRSIVEGNWKKEFRDYVVTETEFASFENIETLKTFDHIGPMGRMIRTKRYKYIIYSEGLNREQLFDMVNDPGEIRNLSKEIGYRDVLENHRDILKRWCVETRDDFNLKSQKKKGYSEDMCV